jgi:hypothetical protein
MRSWRWQVLLSTMLAAGCAAAQDVAGLTDLEPAPLPPGRTLLADLGTYRVGWQSYDQPEHFMPPGWVGHFTEDSGISYLPGQFILDRECFLMHSPWHVPPGRTWVDYPVKLPDLKPVSLTFGITMSPYAMEPGHSTGVTFSAAVITGGQVKPLFHEHCATAAWKDFNFDLSDYAGQTVTLRLAVEPGPDHSPSFAFSYWGDAAITAGAGGESAAALVQRLTSTKAAKATDGASLTALANRPEGGVAPPVFDVGGKNRVEAGDGEVRFIYDGPDANIVYHWKPASGTLDDITVQVDGGRVLHPASGGGIFVAQLGGKSQMLASGGGGSQPRIDGLRASSLWMYPRHSGGLRAKWTFGIAGKALTVAVASDQYIVWSFSLGNLTGAPLRRTVNVPYLDGTFSWLAADGLYFGRWLDWTKSHGSVCQQGESTYRTKTNGQRVDLAEEGYLAVSPSIDEVLPNLPNPQSPFIKTLGDRIMLDVWRHHAGTYHGDAENLRDLKASGVDHVAIIDHDWQRFGYDCKLPDHYPANSHYGTEADLAEFGQVAKDNGYLFSLHENYIDLYPDAPSYDPTARVINSDGSPSLAWYNPGTKVQSFGLKCTRALEYASHNSPEIHRRYGTTAAYLDVHTAVPPWHELDCDAAEPLAAMEINKVIHDTELFAFERKTHGGPLFGEGCWQFYWAGRQDGVEAQVAGGEDHDPYLDFDLLKLHPQMVNHGMGYYERWYRAGYNHRPGVDSYAPEQIDKYRAMEVAYGHAGFVGSDQTDNLQWVAKEHHLMHAVQALYGTAKVSDVRYEVAGQMVRAGVALAVGQRRRQQITYDSGLKVWVNWSPEPWNVAGHILPQWGWWAEGPDTKVGSDLRDGKFADWAETPEYLFADARTSFNMPYLHGAKNIEPKLKSFKDLGGGQIEVVYEWRVGEKLDRNLSAFVHGILVKPDNDGDIVFQGDYRPDPTTDAWQPGQTVVSGPQTLTVPAQADQYDLVIGLYDEQGRVPLSGAAIGGDRVLLGRLKVTKDGEQVKAVTLVPAAEFYKTPATADFKAHTNPAGTWIEFGPLATDGSVKVERGQRRLTVIPYPREAAVKVSLDLAKLSAGQADLLRVKVQAEAWRTNADLGEAAAKIEGGRIVFTTSVAGAGRYVISW